MTPVTAGEQLFLLIRDEVLQAVGSRHVNWSNAAILFHHVDGRPEFYSYVRGAVSVHAMRVMLRHWEEEKQFTPDEAHYVPKVTRFVREHMFQNLDSSLKTRLSRSVIAASEASSRPIPAGVRNMVLRERTLLRCYLCARHLERNAPEGTADSCTLEHVWPASLGGDSVEKNLLPACLGCQQATKDTLSWEWFNVHNLVLPGSPSAGALMSVDRTARYARHYLEAMRLCETDGLSLKEAFLRLGPINPTLKHTNTGMPLTFFDLDTI